MDLLFDVQRTRNRNEKDCHKPTRSVFVHFAAARTESAYSGVPYLAENEVRDIYVDVDHCEIVLNAFSQSVSSTSFRQSNTSSIHRSRARY